MPAEDSNRKEKHYPGFQTLCQRCQRPFHTTPSGVRRGAAKYCSTACASDVRRGRQQGPFAESFWEKVQKTLICWIWTGGKTGGGYGEFSRWHGPSTSRIT